MSASELLMEDITKTQLRVPAKPPNKGSTKPLFSVGGKSSGFNPCKAIHYVVHVGSGPANGVALVREGISRVEAATGLRFVYDGTTNTIPKSLRSSGPVADLSKVFTPVFIGWATRSQTDVFDQERSEALGVATPTVIVLESGDELFVSGAVLLLPTDLQPTFGPGGTVGNVLLHELGHLVGLDHVDNSDELMFPSLGPQTREGYGPGDRRGLWDLGASRGCASSWIRLR